MGSILEQIIQWFIDFLTTGATKLIDSILFAIYGLSERLLGDALVYFSKIYSSVINDTEIFKQIPSLSKVVDYLKVVAFLILIMFLAIELIKRYMLGTENGESNPLVILRDGAIGIILIIYSGEIINRIYAFGILLVNDLITVTGYGSVESFTSILKEEWMDKLAVNGLEVSFNLFEMCIHIVGALALTLILIILLAQAVLRKAELFYYQVLAPIMAVNGAFNNKELWIQFIKGVVVLSLSQALQYILIIFMFEALIYFDNVLMGMIFSIAFGYLNVKAPGALKGYIHSTGMGDSVMSTSRTLMMMKRRG